MSDVSPACLVPSPSASEARSMSPPKLTYNDYFQLFALVCYLLVTLLDNLTCFSDPGRPAELFR